MKKYGKITALIAGVVLALGFASCKADTDDGSTFYTVTFNSMGGTEVSSQSIESGNKATKPAAPTKQATETETYTFDNWYTSTDNGTTLSDTAFDFNTPITKDITLYAKWAANAVTHTVSFDTKGGSDVASQTIVHGNKAAKPTNPTKAATETETYAFDSWYTSTDGGATLSDTAFDFDTAITDNITLYAKWAVNAVTHTVTFDTDGGSPSPAEQTIVHGNKATKPAAPTKQTTETETYTFDNWYTSTDGGATLSETAFDFDTAIETDITLYAKWTVNAVTHTVTFDTKGGSMSPAEQTIVHGNKATKPADPTKTETETEAFVFAGWYTSTDGGTTLSDTTFDFDTAITDNISLYAKWNVSTKYIELKNCSVIRTMFKTLCKYDYDNSSYNYKFTKTITRFAKADARPEAAENYIDAAGNQIPLWYDEGKTTLYYYLEPGKKMTLRTTDDTNSLFKDMSDAVSIETGDFDTSKVTDMGYMFGDCKALTSLDLSSFDTSNVTYMSGMFGYCQSLTSLDLSKFDTSKVTDMSYMFSDCKALTSLDVSSFDTSKVTSMSYMFYNCQSLTSLDLSSFDTSNVTYMSDMFGYCQSLTSLDLSKFDTSKVTDMGYMFFSCKTLTSLDVSSFDTSNVTNLGSMFLGCKALTSLDLSKFDTSNVTDMGYMFDYCQSLTTITASEKFVTDNVTRSSIMFADCTSLKGGAGTVYDGNHTDKEYARIDGGTEKPGYFTKKQ